jgi:hypothetical protein
VLGELRPTTRRLLDRVADDGHSLNAIAARALGASERGQRPVGRGSAFDAGAHAARRAAADFVASAIPSRSIPPDPIFYCVTGGAPFGVATGAARFRNVEAIAMARKIPRSALFGGI